MSKNRSQRAQRQPPAVSEEETFSSQSLVRDRTRRMVQVASLPMLFFLLMPLLALLVRSTSAHWVEYLNNPQVIQAIGISLLTTTVATVLAIILGTPLAYGLAKDIIPFRRVIDTLIDLPIILPPAVAGLALLITFGRSGLLGGALQAFGIQIPFTPMAVVLAQLFVSASFYIKSATLGFSSIDRELEQAAGLDGASTRQSFRYVILPLAWAPLTSGSVTTWARALGEFGATIIFAGNFIGRTQTMPLAIYLGFEQDLDMALTLSVVLVGLAFLALLLVRWVLQREITI